MLGFSSRMECFSPQKVRVRPIQLQIRRYNCLFSSFHWNMSLVMCNMTHLSAECTACHIRVVSQDHSSSFFNFSFCSCFCARMLSKLRASSQIPWFYFSLRAENTKKSYVTVRLRKRGGGWHVYLCEHQVSWLAQELTDCSWGNVVISLSYCDWL